MEFTAEQLQEKFQELITVVETFISSPRKEQLVALYKKYEERFYFAPASGKEHFHNAFPGGYLVHILNVVTAARGLYQAWKAFGIKVDNFTEEELVFSALNHDLGKIGDEEGEYYLPNPSSWHRINQGKIYILNPALNFMNVTDRTFFMLQKNGIVVTQNEYLGILLTDGLYEEKNKPYLVTFDKDYQLKINLPHLLHHADMMSLTKERDLWRKENADTLVAAKIDTKNMPKSKRSDPVSRNEDRKKAFEKGKVTLKFETLLKQVGEEK